ncbi:transglycosylase domain-containing protein [Pararhizobium mangrovi]|uniref:PBP1A family penicillin-binding protein n=1 Tax=Pararhizobium mangrovi TaxID=2590452 RepID=A0A506UHE4_9HYPH|nr:PBP1A family penicillin-binding protein [Pararhizobium mangrovi]TPW32734.1 PBP1A family penicillin-binding protein [Pararhizobium mangrovi]
MQHPFKNSKLKRRLRHLLLRADSFIDSTLWSTFFEAGDTWEEIVLFFRRFRVRGTRRLFFEAAGEAMTLGVAGTVLMLALALPAFQATQGDWRAQDEYAVTFLDRYGNEIGHRGIRHEDSVPIDELPDTLVKSVVATEDRRFFQHYGIDFLGLARAMVTNARANGVVQGGSTITQQVAKNMFLSNERTLQRKMKEAFLAVWLEANLTKKEILSLYLDRMYMGGGTFGVAAASQYYFGKDVRDIDLAQSAMLAGLFKAPSKYAPSANLPAARARANEVLTNLVQGHLMSEGQVVGARLHPASVVDRGEKPAPDYFLDWAYDEVKRIAQEHRIRRHSLIVRTTVDMNLQRAADESLKSSLRQYGDAYNVSQGAIVLLQNGGRDPGAVRAMVGGRDYGESQFNRAVNGRRQPGSSFKVYVYATAMEHGMTPDTRITDKPITWNGWSPRNYERTYEGHVTLTRALAKSINTVPVRLTRDHLGTVAVAKTAHDMGVESPISTDKTMALGTSEVTALDQATAYSVFPDGGLQSGRHGIDQIMDYSGDVLFDQARDTPPRKRVLTEKAADEMNQILVQIPEWGTGRRAKIDGLKTAGKTGTTQSYRDGWFCGYTGNYTTAVWIGNDDYTPSNRMTGGTLPAMTWKKVMEYAQQGVEPRAIPGIKDPLPSAADREKLMAGAREGIDGMEAMSRPLALSHSTTELLRTIAEKLSSAAPLSRPSRVASTASPSSPVEP